VSQQELLKRVVQTLTGAGIEYMLTGSLVSSLQGEPRASHDIDVVVALDISQATRLAAAFPPPDFYLSDAAIQEAIRDQRTFNLLDLVEGDKVDFWILTGEPFDRSRFARRRLEKAGGLAVYASAPEDTILMKLRWAELSGGSEKQFGDARSVYEVQQPRLDVAYLESWIQQLGLQAVWERLKNEAKTISPE
jgi:hypothetical protein